MRGASSTFLVMAHMEQSTPEPCSSGLGVGHAQARQPQSRVGSQPHCAFCLGGLDREQQHGTRWCSCSSARECTRIPLPPAACSELGVSIADRACVPWASAVVHAATGARPPLHTWTRYPGSDPPLSLPRPHSPGERGHDRAQRGIVPLTRPSPGCQGMRLSPAICAQSPQTEIHCQRLHD